MHWSWYTCNCQVDNTNNCWSQTDVGVLVWDEDLMMTPSLTLSSCADHSKNSTTIRLYEGVLTCRRLEHNCLECTPTGPTTDPSTLCTWLPVADGVAVWLGSKYLTLICRSPILQHIYRYCWWILMCQELFVDVISVPQDLVSVCCHLEVSWWLGRHNNCQEGDGNLKAKCKLVLARSHEMILYSCVTSCWL